MALLEVRDLKVGFHTPEGEVEAVTGVSFDLNPGQKLGVVGESGSGKTQSALAMLGLLAENGRASGSVKFRGQELLGLSTHELSRIRGSSISMIFQDPMSSLNPYVSIGDQLIEVLTHHRNLKRREARMRAEEMLNQVRINHPVQRMRQFPHELSGGMCQRVMIAMGLLCQPDILIADEPTTALDVTVQSQIIRLLDELAEQSSTAILLITHDLGIIAGLSDHVLVMRHGEIVERADVDPLFESPAHPYTELLLKSVPRLDQPLAGTEPSKPDSTPRQARAPVLTIEQLSVQYQVSTGNGWLKPHFDTIRAVDDISFELQPAETLGIVGESGCGKSTLARAILGLVRPASGQIVWMGKNLVELDEDSMRRQRRDIQMVFQDPLGSLDPRMTVGQIIGEPLRNFFPSMSRLQVRERALGMLQMVGLRPEHINRYPHEFSGGQCQRIGIARALVANPRLVVCDEPVSALDVSIQAQIIKLLQDLQQKLRLSLIFIAHDLSVVRHMSDRVLVMHEGKIVELADSDRIYTDPQHPYTQQLIESVPIPDPAAERERSRRLAERLDQVVE